MSDPNEAFFRRAWLTLKATNPRLNKRMTEIECGIEGIRVREQKPVSNKKKKGKDGQSNEIIPV